MLYNKVSKLIGEKRLTIAETARIANVRYNTIYNLYHDKTTSIEFETINKLCYALECTPNDLFRYVPDEEPPV